jgi:hypothetical protein
VVDVVGKPHRDPAAGRLADRAGDDPGRLGPEVEVIDGDLERPLGAREKGRQLARDRLGGLTAVAQRAQLDQTPTA